jgi:hypothetical protein
MDPAKAGGHPGSPFQARRDRSSWRSDWLAGHVGLELRNVDANYPFERSHRFAGIQPNFRGKHPPIRHGGQPCCHQATRLRNGVAIVFSSAAVRQCAGHNLLRAGCNVNWRSLSFGAPFRRALLPSQTECTVDQTGGLGRVISRIKFASGGHGCHNPLAMHLKVDVEVRVADVISDLARAFGVVNFQLQDAPDHPHHVHLPDDPAFR